MILIVQFIISVFVPIDSLVTTETTESGGEVKLDGRVFRSSGVRGASGGWGTRGPVTNNLVLSLPPIA